jgi:hypothetical protein
MGMHAMIDAHSTSRSSKILDGVEGIPFTKPDSDQGAYYNPATAYY